MIILLEAFYYILSLKLLKPISVTQFWISSRTNYTLLQLSTPPLSLETKKTNFQRGFVATEGFQRLVDASEEEQRELHMLRAGGILPPGITDTPSPAAVKSAAAASASSTGNWRLPVSPPFLAGLVTRLRKLPIFMEKSKGASATRRRRRGAGAIESAHSGDAVSRDSRRASGRMDGGVTIDADLDLAPMPQSEEGVQMLEAGRAARGEVGGVECIEDVERGERDASASGFEVYQNSRRYFGR